MFSANKLMPQFWLYKSWVYKNFISMYKRVIIIGHSCTMTIFACGKQQTEHNHEIFMQYELIKIRCKKQLEKAIII